MCQAALNLIISQMMEGWTSEEQRADGLLVASTDVLVFRGIRLKQRRRDI